MMSTDRIVHYMAKEELFKGLHGKIFNKIGLIKVYRGKPNYKAIEEAEKIEKQLKKKELDLDDYLIQLRQIKKMGSFSSLLKMIPGMNQLKDVKVDDKEFERIEAIICSMTKAEKRDPRIFNGSRRLRIAKGSGTTVQEINKFMKSFEMTQKMMKKMQANKGGMKNMLKGMDIDSLKNIK